MPKHITAGPDRCFSTENGPSPGTPPASLPSGAESLQRGRRVLYGLEQSCQARVQSGGSGYRHEAE